MFYKKYGITWEKEIKDFEKNLNYYIFLKGLNDPITDYFNYFYR